MKKVYSLLIALSLCTMLFAQNISANNDVSASEFSGSVQQAMSNTDYMVTAGDVYSLTYAANGVPVNYTIAVDPTYRIRVSNLAVLDVYGKSYITVKKQVEEIVQKNYPMSGAQFVLLNPASFKVVVTGEVKSTAERSAWALTRLSSVIAGTTTDYSSIRDITIKSTNGKTKTCDLFKATRFGDFSQNPYVRPGDVITINRIKRVVTIGGSVERPGSYELMKDENLKELVEYYSNGLTELADTSRITLVRNRGSEAKSGDTIYLKNSDIISNYTLNNGDSIYIHSVSELAPKIIVEGIINNPNSKADNATNEVDVNGNAQKASAIDAAYRTSINFVSGENYATLIRRISYMFSTYSDLQNAYVIRKDEKLLMNIEDIIYNSGFMSKYTVEQDDKLVIPFQQNFQKIIINGEVKSVSEINAWPLRRLSSIIQDYLTDYSSHRFIQVTSVDGKIDTYDLFLASRFGDLSQDPYIRSGETITIPRIDRRVTIKGAVERPGTYELRSDENLKDLVEYYGNGLTPKADPNRMMLTHYVTEESKLGNAVYLQQDAIDSNFALVNYDTVEIESYTKLKPVMFVEGAVHVTDGSTVLDSSSRSVIRFDDNTRYTFLIRNNAGLFSSSAADISRAYINRKGEIIPLDISKILYDPANEIDLTVEPFDTVIVPFRQMFVTVSGAVYAPGRYPYIPDRTADYYIGLAGGFIKDKNWNENISIVDIDGKHVKDKAVITPECTITVPTNSFSYFFNKYAPVVTTAASLITTTISVIVTTKNLSGK